MAGGGDSGQRISRRTYLKGLAATGVATSLAGCAKKYNPGARGIPYQVTKQTLLDFEYADHRKTEQEFTKKLPKKYHLSGSKKITVTYTNHAVTYWNQGADGEVSESAGVITMANPTEYMGVDIPENPFAKLSLTEIVTHADYSLVVLDGMGIDVDALEWESGPYASPAKHDLIEFSGYVRTNDNTRRAIVLYLYKETDQEADPPRVVIVGTCLHRMVTDDTFSNDTTAR